MDVIEHVPVFNEAVEQNALFPGLDAYNVRHRKMLDGSTSMFPVGWNNELCKCFSFSIGWLHIWDRVGNYNNVRGGPAF
jgi:hypothetical protein